MNLPNKLTLLRVAMVPIFMVFAAWVKFGTPDFSRLWSFIAGAVFALASLTDLLDGKIARKYHLETDFGKFADPLADKMLTTAAFLYMMADGVCSPVVLALTLFREFAVAGIRMVAAANQKVIAANMWGKVKTVLQMASILLYYFLAAAASGSDALFVSLVTQALCWAVAAVTVVSGVIYIKDNWAVVKG
ncbi:CDP-diacylglycerol--glycerol-3-phosphate 3-phosphatidyltransferase [Acutalibacter sp. 1XD8-33]|nr:CDP-diacylglycerol--glycerol-3-phosphate 3-phosphatidyltransferase [Acutalibacter sp. 1XD8-33]RKJ40634.1 CDP-diacylglycerol--glycerol-3-phosphate 3-phosphatidyltransferase [Acutalibacter sp. 1XD8-33]